MTDHAAPWPDGRPPRTWLFLPADRAADRLGTAMASGADVVILDLEDGVAPVDRPAARAALAAAVGEVARTVPLFVRPNGPTTDDLAPDLAAISTVAPDGLIVPKCEDPTSMARVRAAWPAGTPFPPAAVALVETPAGVLAASSIARSDPALVALAFGAEDLARATGARRTEDGLEILAARSLVVLAAAAAGIAAIDTPSLELADLAAVERDARIAAGLGFDGKLVIHPRQVAPVRRAWRPSAEALAQARDTVAAASARGERGDGAAAARGRMIDRPVIEAARRLLAEAAEDEQEGR